MKAKMWAFGAAALVAACAASAAYCGTDATAPNAAAITPQQLAKVVPGTSTKADVKSLLGTPWRVVQFNDCGTAMDDQADETWEYRGTGPNGSYRVHVEFGDSGVVHLLARIPDSGLGDKAVAAKVAPHAAASGMSM